MDDAKKVQAVLNIIVANDFAYVNGGAAQVALSSVKGLAKRGHRVIFLSAVGPVDSDLGECGAELVITKQFDIKSDPNRLRAVVQGVWNRRAASEMQRLLRGLDRTDTIVHVHGWPKALTSSIIRVAISSGYHVVVTLHDYFYACPNGGFYNFRTGKLCPLRPLSLACLTENCDRDGYAQKLWRSIRLSAQNRFGFIESGLLSFITLSNLSESVLKPFLPPDARLQRIDNPNEIADEGPADVAHNGEFVYLGRLSPDKGVELLADACRDTGCKAVFVGEGPSRVRIEGTLSKESVVGWQSRACAHRRLRQSRGLVLPSLWYEAQPLVVLEAAALGVPAIVSDQCAARELVKDGQTGLWFRSGDVRDLREKLLTLADPELASRMGRAAYEQYWSNPLTLEKHLDSLEEHYRSLLGCG